MAESDQIANIRNKRIAIKAPEYLPRLSYLALMHSVDVFVLADTFQYSRQSFQNRTRIRTPQGWHWISVPLEGRQHGRPMQETHIDQRTHWQSKHTRSIQFNYSQTPFYAYYEDAIRSLIKQDWRLLGDLTCTSVQLLHELFEMKCTLVRGSSLPGAPDSTESIIKTLQPVSVLLDASQAFFQDAIAVPRMQMDFAEPSYRQQFEGFEPAITGLDVLCNYGPSAIGVVEEGSRIA